MDVFLLLASPESTGLFRDGEQAAQPGPCPGSPSRSDVRSVGTGPGAHLPREGRHPLTQNPAHPVSPPRFTHRKDLGGLQRASVTQTGVHPHPTPPATTHRLQGPPEKRAQRREPRADGSGHEVPQGQHLRRGAASSGLGREPQGGLWLWEVAGGSPGGWCAWTAVVVKHCTGVGRVHRTKSTHNTRGAHVRPAGSGGRQVTLLVMTLRCHQCYLPLGNLGERREDLSVLLSL